MNKDFVGGLSWNTDQESLANNFSKFGNIEEATVITDRETGRSRGFGFVTFSDAESADRSVKEMDGVELDGRNIKVNIAKERSDRGGGNNRNFSRNRW